MFTQNLISYFETGEIGKCSACGGKLTIEEFETPIRTNCVIRCENCGKYDYFTGMTKQSISKCPWIKKESNYYYAEINKHKND